MGASVREKAAVLALVRATNPGEYHLTSDIIAEGGGTGAALRLLDGDLTGLAALTARRLDYVRALLARVSPGDLDRAHELVENVTAQDVRLLTVLDDDYPLNLQLVRDRPPVIWVRGRLDARDLRVIAVVGTRHATAEGGASAGLLARQLVDAGFTVVSGLSRGIDAAAHTAALDAGGRTVAVLGAGILAPIHPAENADLAYRIARHGALVSQFWPATHARRANLAARHAVTSGIAVGTLVVEAHATSGAMTQARLALEHGKRLFLLDRLVEREAWARRYAARAGVTVVRGVDDILGAVGGLAAPPPSPRRLPLTL
jgi:DNA processing protein